MTETTLTPDAALVDEAAEMLGCKEAVHRGQRLGWCISHGMTKRTPWPCPVRSLRARSGITAGTIQRGKARSSELHMLVVAGLSDAAIVDRLGIAAGSVRKSRERQGIPHARRHSARQCQQCTHDQEDHE